MHNHNHASTALHLRVCRAEQHTHTSLLCQIHRNTHIFYLFNPYTIRAPCLCARHFMCKYPIEQFDFDSVTLHVKIVFFFLFFCLHSLAHIHSFRFVRMNYEYLTGIERLASMFQLLHRIFFSFFFLLYTLQNAIAAIVL